jgi:cell division protein FtsQ
MTGAGDRRWRLVRASTDAVPASVRRFFMADRGRRPEPGRRFRPPGRRWALVAVAVGLLLVAGWVLWGTSLLGVREVRVAGTEILSPAQVREAAAVTLRTPLLRVPLGEVAARVETLAPVAEARVRRDWPDAVVIEVVERTAVAAVPVGDGFLRVDGSGVGFQTVARAGDLPVVLLATPGPDDPATRAALTVLSALTPPLRADLESLVVPEPTDIRLVLASGWTVVWGDATDSEAKARVATTLLEREGEVIDVSTPDVVSVR